MRLNPRLSALALCLLVPACGDGEDLHASGTGGTTGTGGAAGAAGQGIDPLDFVKVKKSCAYDCPIATCAEKTTPYACQNADKWSAIPHAAECPSWDGSYPTPS